MNRLETIIRRRIREKKVLPFRDFMELALYCPELGYYENERHPFGKKGDFYTAPGVHPVFGETLARDLLQKWRQLGIRSPLLIVEFGAGQGTLARDILDGIRSLAPDLFPAVDYRIVEKSGRLRQLQRLALENYPVKWLSSLDDLGSFTGIVLSNELMDAFPVHLVERGGDETREIYVAEQNGRLAECTGPLSDPRIIAYIRDYAPPLRPGQRIEVNLAALDWLREVGDSLRSGFVITIDYGDEANVLYEGRTGGTLRAYRRHQLAPNPLEQPGEQDLTADVNFTALIRYGERLRLQPVFYGTQAQYLLQAGILENAAAETGTDPFRDGGVKRNLAIKHLILPGGMGERFKVLVQRKMGS